ncbi:aspartate dehydrogenase [Bosea thiooxidans]
MKPRSVAVIGFGAIAGELVETLRASAEPPYRILVWLRPDSPSRERVPAGVDIAESAAELAEFAPDLVVEAAGHAAVREQVLDALSLGLPVLVSSIGALHDEALKTRLVEAAKSHGGRLLLPSGALGALDYVRAVRSAHELDLTYESHKPPAAWAKELEALGQDPQTVAAPLTLFEGTAREAAAAYPQNLNVAAALALAGPGFERTRVSVVCDPEAKGNTHVVKAQSEFGTMQVTIANRPSPTNPKSSWIVGRSLLAAIDQYFSPVMML